MSDGRSEAYKSRLKVVCFSNTIDANKWLETNPIIRNIHVTDSQDDYTITYHYEE